MVGGNPFILSKILMILQIFMRSSTVLDGIIIDWVVPMFWNLLNRWSHHFIELPTLLLLCVQGCSHVQILLLVYIVSVGRLVNRISLSMHNSFILSIICGLSCFFNWSRHFHLPFEINFGLLVAFLPVLNLFVPTLYKMVTSGNVIMPIILYTLLGILFIKIEFFNDFTK